MDAHSFRLQKCRDFQTTLETAVAHSERVRKKYAKTCSILRKIKIVMGTLSVALGTSGLATSLSGIGVAVGAPLASVAGILGIISVTSSTVSKRFRTKMVKHERAEALGRTTLNTILDLLSKALSDNNIDEREFTLVIEEMEKFNESYRTLRRVGSSNSSVDR